MHRAVNPAGRRVRWVPSRPSTLLVVILAVQAALSARLIMRNTAFQDEALYLWAGHLEISHWLSGVRIPAFPTYFSGSPVLYPPVAALADSLGGLAGARLLSLLLMLAATTLLWSTAARLWGRRAAYVSAALFAALGVTERLGAFATYDPASLCLLALAAWCAVRAAESPRTQGWLAGAAVALTMANATKYASALFDPVVIGLAVIVTLRATDLRRALTMGLTLLGYTAGLLSFLYALGGGEYGTGIAQSTLARSMGVIPASVVFSEAWHLTALAIAPAVTGLVICLLLKSSASNDRLLLSLLVLAGLLVPIEQAHIHTILSLDKHVDYGSWFTAAAAGYTAEKILQFARGPRLRIAVSAAIAAALAATLGQSIAQGDSLFADWPNSASLVSVMAKVMPAMNGPVLAEHPSILQYYLPAGRAWYRWSSTYSIRLADGSSIGASVGHSLRAEPFTSRIRAGFFSLIILDFEITPELDRQILQAIELNPDYSLVAEIPYGPRGVQVWEYRPQAHFTDWTSRADVTSSPFYVSVFAPAAQPGRLSGEIVAAVLIAGLLAIMILVLIRYTWRRRRAIDEL